MSLTEKEKLFCLYYSQTRNARSAAVRAGYKVLPKKSGAKLIARKDIIKEVTKLNNVNPVTSNEVLAGYRQLAFGSVADALKLILMQENPSIAEAEELDLFNVSEIKKPKGGGIEIKFFDRIKALEHIEALNSTESEDENALPFYKALEKSADAIRADSDG